MPGFIYRTRFRERYPPPKWKTHLLPHLLCSNSPQLQRLQWWLQFIVPYKNKITNKHVLKAWQLAVFCGFSYSFSLFMKIPVFILPQLKLCICLYQYKYVFLSLPFIFTLHLTQSLLQYRKFAIVFAASEQFLLFFSHSNILSTLTPS